MVSNVENRALEVSSVMNPYIQLKAASEPCLLIPLTSGVIKNDKRLKSLPHRHPVYHIYIILEGQAHATLRQGLKQVSVGDVLLVQPNEIHAINTDSSVRYLVMSFYLASMEVERELLECSTRLDGFSALDQEIWPLLITERLQNLLGWLQIPDDFSIPRVSLDRLEERCHFYLQQLDRDVFEIFFLREQRRSKDQFLLRAMIQQVLFELNEVLFDVSEASVLNDPLVEKIIRVLKGHLREPLCLDDIATEVDYSKEYMCQVFKKKTGMSIMKKMQELRIQKACEYLKSESSSVTEIAHRLNFSSSQHLNKVFKEWKGCTPLQMRKKLKYI